MMIGPGRPTIRPATLRGTDLAWCPDHLAVTHGNGQGHPVGSGDERCRPPPRRRPDGTLPRGGGSPEPYDLARVSPRMTSRIEPPAPLVVPPETIVPGR